MFDTEKFIKEVQCRPALYDTKMQDYHNREAKAKMWQDIGAAMYASWETFAIEEKERRGKELGVKWKSIRDHFIKELKIFGNENASRNLKKKKKYIYYDQLTFLLPTVDSRHFKSPENENESNILFRELIREDFDGEAVSLESNTSNTNISLENDFDFKVANKKMKNENYNDPNLTQDCYNNPLITNATDVLQVEQGVGLNVQHQDYLTIQQTDNKDRMGNNAFLSSLLPLINKIPDESLIDCRIELMQTIQKYMIPSKYVNERIGITSNVFSGN